VTVAAGKVDSIRSRQVVSLHSARGRGVLLATVLGSGVAFLDGTVVNVALPVLGRELHAGIAGLQWTVDAYLLTLTALLLVGGSLGDALGRRKMFVAGLVWFAVASAACGLSPSIGALVAARAVQGAGAALLVPGSLAVLRASFAEEDQGRAIGAWSGLSGVTTAIGPLVGGWLIEAWSWRVVFFLNIPLTAVAAWVALRCVPESRAPERRRIDLPGAAAATLGLAGSVYALIEARRQDATIAIAAVLGVVALAAFVWIESRRSEPMLPLELFRSSQFSGSNAVTLAVYFGLSGATFLLVLYVQSVLGYSPLAAGAALTPVTILLLLLSPAAGKLAGRIGCRPLMTAGPVVVAAGLALLAGLGRGSSYVRALLPGMVVFGVGLATTVAPLTIAVLESADERHAGIAAAVNTAVARLAGLLAVAVLPLLAGIAAADPQSLVAGYARAMSICAALCAAGGACALVTLRPVAAAARRDGGHRVC
jgi:EmrB/QacA subfamily drug resistance transporter